MPGGKYGSNRPGNKGKFKMKLKGFPDSPLNYKKYKDSPMNMNYDESPLNKNGEDKHPLASHHEKKKGTYVTGDNSNREKINDLEDRIEFLQSDLSDAKAPAKKASLNNQIKNLKSQLAKLR